MLFKFLLYAVLPFSLNFCLCFCTLTFVVIFFPLNFCTYAVFFPLLYFFHFFVYFMPRRSKAKQHAVGRSFSPNMVLDELATAGIEPNQANSRPQLSILKPALASSSTLGPFLVWPKTAASGTGYCQKHDNIRKLSIDRFGI